MHDCPSGDTRENHPVILRLTRACTTGNGYR